MARFVNTIKYAVNADSAQEARSHAETVVRVGTDHNYLTGAEVVSVEPVAEPIYTQAQLDEAVRAAVEGARSNA